MVVFADLKVQQQQVWLNREAAITFKCYFVKKLGQEHSCTVYTLPS